MEHVRWNDADIQEQFKDCANLGEIIREIEASQSAMGHVICQISVNGMNLTEIDENRFASSVIGEIKTLDIHYTAVRDLLVETESSTMDYAKSLVPESLRVADLFRAKGENEAHINFKKLVEALEDLTQANQLILNVKTQEGIEISDSYREIDRNFVVLLNEILIAYEKRDFILTADILEYDLTQTLIELAKAFGETIGGRHQGDTVGR